MRLLVICNATVYFSVKPASAQIHFSHSYRAAIFMLEDLIATHL